jgi:hypothetical protein
VPLFIGEEYKLESMKYNVVLYCKPEVDKEKSERMKETLRKRFGEDVKFKSEDNDVEDNQKGWSVAGYFANVENALSYCVVHEIEKSKLKDLETVVDLVKQLEANIKIALSKIPVENVKSVMVKDDKDEEEMVE